MKTTLISLSLKILLISEVEDWKPNLFAKSFALIPFSDAIDLRIQLFFSKHWN